MISLRPLLALALSALLITPAAAQQRTQYVFAASWQPGFCETRPEKPECESQTADRFDASHFTLHGLWPQRVDYCDVSREVQLTDDRGDWDELPAVELPAAMRSELDEVMPGTQSALERHEWIKHGTCYDGGQGEYFGDSLAMMEALNTSAVRELFAANVGKELTQAQIRGAFDEAFGNGAGERVRIACSRDGNRRIITEITIGLTGEIRDAGDFAALITAARPTDGGCDAGIVDRVGLQ